MPGENRKETLFPSTRWTLVQRARGEESKKALGELLQAYWRPLYVFARGRGMPGDQAADSVQNFILHLLERAAFVQQLDPERGRLRAYLKSAFRNFLNGEYERSRAQKRGGDQPALSLDWQSVESYVGENAAEPDLAYEREWAANVFESALRALEKEFESGERSGPFQLVQRYFDGNISSGYSELAAENAMSLPQLKSFLHRARQRYRELLESEVAETLDGEDQTGVETELARLREALSR